MYDIPASRGLKSFHCKVAYDWKSLLSGSDPKGIADDDPALLYLQQTNSPSTMS